MDPIKGILKSNEVGSEEFLGYVKRLEEAQGRYTIYA